MCVCVFLPHGSDKLRIIESPFATNKALPASHPFEQIKRRFYIRNTPESISIGGDSAGSHFNFKFRINTVKLNLTPVERGFYDEQARKVKSTNLFSDRFLPVRQMCDHPAANAQWNALLNPKSAFGDEYELLSLEVLRRKFIDEKQRQAAHLQDEIDRLCDKQKAAHNTVAVVTELHHKMKGQSHADGCCVAREDDVKTLPLMLARERTQFRVVTSHTSPETGRRVTQTEFLYSRVRLRKWLVSECASQDQREHVLAGSQAFIASTDSSMRVLSTEQSLVEKERAYFETVLSQLDDGGTNNANNNTAVDETGGRECIICNGKGGGEEGVVLG